VQDTVDENGAPHNRVVLYSMDGMSIGHACSRVLVAPLGKVWYCLTMMVASTMVVFFYLWL
jgi:high-affinity nickel permease